MLFALHNAFSAGRLNQSGLNYLLPALTHRLQTRFCRFVDGGAGIGDTAKAYNQILRSNLNDENKPHARLTCYEPLKENFVVMNERLKGDQYKLHQAALCNFKGTTNFNVVSRMSGTVDHWSPGTSYCGFIGEDVPSYEAVEVSTVRLQDDLEYTPDFVKLDLQGGEFEALKGLGDQLAMTKLTYTETQLFGKPEAAEYLATQGFLVLYDKFQIGLSEQAHAVPLQELADMGLCIDSVYLSDGSGIPSRRGGYATGGRDLVEGFTFKPEVVQALRTMGITYFQTDIIGINTRFADDILPVLHTVI